MAPEGGSSSSSSWALWAYNPLALAFSGVRLLLRLLSPWPPAPALPPIKRKVVVVGGGFGGASVAKALETVAEVTLIDSKEFFEIKWAEPRVLVEPSLAARAFFPHSAYLREAHIIVGLVTHVSTTEVTLADGTTVPFDFLVIACGIKAEPTVSLRDKIAHNVEDNKKLQAAKSVLVVGGGPTGVELAAEVITDFPDKDVTLVHGGPRLLQFVGERAGQLSLHWLQSKGVKVLLNEKIDISPEQEGSSGTFVTQSGREIQADFLLVAVGGRPTAQWLKESFPWAMETPFLDVDPCLRVKGCTNVFAAGDIANLKDMKQGYLARAQGLLVAENIRRLIRAARGSGSISKEVLSDTPLKKHPAQAEAGLVSLGRNDGVASLPFGTFTGWFPTWIKSRGLFIDKTHHDLGVILPS